LVIRVRAADAFDTFSAALKPEAERGLKFLARDLATGMGRIEVRGYASDGPLPPAAPYRDAWDLSYQRAYSSAAVLATAGIARERIDVTACGAKSRPSVTTPGAIGTAARGIEIVVSAAPAAPPESDIAGKGRSINGG